MLNSISWEGYLSAIALLVGGYYAIATILLYSNEIKNIVNQKARKNSNEDVSENQSDSNESNSLMGDIRYESLTQGNVSREQILATEEMSFAPLAEADEPIDGTLNNAINRFVSTLLTEIESLLEVIARDNKKETATLFQALLHNYPQLVATDFQDEVSQHIYDALKIDCEFQIELNEVKSWWPVRQPKSDDNQ
ncbi:MAG: hypothetical protein U5K54_25935 [Cytophagales bacterium]|nr:hypothetical protein [Cytophagales bacterium]